MIRRLLSVLHARNLEFLRDRGMLTRTADSALPSLYEATHEEPYQQGGKGFSSWPATKWAWAGELAERQDVYLLHVHRGKNLLVTPGVYHLNAPLNITRANTVVLGLGLHHFSIPVAIALAVLSGAGIGLFSGLLIAYFDLAAFVMNENAPLIRTLVNKYDLGIVAPADIEGDVAQGRHPAKG